MATMMTVVSKMLWIAAGIGSVGGAVLLVFGIASTSAPQQGAAGAMGAAVAILPYVLARSWDELMRRPAL